MNDVEKRLQQARRQAAQARAEVAALSNQRVDQLRAMPLRQAAKHVDDACLTPEDRDELKRWLSKKLPVQTPTTHGMSSFAGDTFRRIGRCVLSCHGLFMVMAICGAIVVAGWLKTPRSIGRAVLTVDLAVTWPDGSVQTMPRSQNYAVTALVDGKWVLRIWRPGRGYDTVLVPANVVQFS